MKTNALKPTLACITLLCVTAILGNALAKEKEDHGHAVTIQSLKFEPKSIDVKVGETVVWTNTDDRDYSVDAKDGSFSSGNLRAGKTYEFKFTKAGKFPYGCTYHPRMSGVVVVSDK